MKKLLKKLLNLRLRFVVDCNFNDLSEKEKQKYFDWANELITDDVLFCTRVWSAWNVGTMSEDDFFPAYEDDDFIYRIAEALFESSKNKIL